MTRKTSAVKARPYNATLRALLDAFARKDPDAWGPLADHLEELEAEDLAEQVRDYARRGGMWGKSYRSPKRLAGYLSCWAAERGILDRTDEPQHRHAIALHAALAKVDPAAIAPVATAPPDAYQDRAALLRRFLKEQSIPHVSVRTETFTGGGRVIVDCPYRLDCKDAGRCEGCEACESNRRACEVFKRIIAAAFPEPPCRLCTTEAGYFIEDYDPDEHLRWGWSFR